MEDSTQSPLPELNHSTPPSYQVPSSEEKNPEPYTPSIRNQHNIQERIQLGTLCWTLFLAGWNDGSVGPLVPRIQQVYHLGYTIVSLLFVLQFVGAICGALLNVGLNEKYGFGKLLLLGSSMQVVAYTLQAAALPFPVFVLGSFINGAGLAIQDAQANGYVAGIAENSETKMGFVQAAYGAGALVAPLVSTQFAQLQHWSFHYLVSLGVTGLNTAFLAVVFRARTQDECLARIGQVGGETGTSERSHFRQIISIKAVHLLALFLFVYVGVEVTIGGWIVSYMITVRGGGPSSGYISAGFFGGWLSVWSPIHLTTLNLYVSRVAGLTLGRLILLPVNKKIGERRVVYIYGVLAIALEFIIWFVPSLVGGAIAVSLVGLMLGPMYPIAMNHAGRVFPRWLVTGAIGWTTAIATTGAAIAPFVTGAIASKAGIKSLEPVVVALLATMVGLWALVPGKKISS
ncbi:major facilitator superfamily domain-containing protein [Mycena crocata]|nr:major facilitator superfamily domain-containing protein [Mycena crocata]